MASEAYFCVALLSHLLEALFSLRQLSLVRLDGAQVVLRDFALLAPGVLVPQIGEDSQGFLILGFLRGETGTSVGRGPDRRLLNLDGFGQRFFTHAVLFSLIVQIAGEQQAGHRHDRAIADDLFFVLFEERDCKPDFLGKLIAL